MILADIKTGQKVLTKTVDLRPGLLVDPQYLAHRQEEVKGVVVNPVKDHEGVWWVMHSHGVAPYWYHEFELMEDQEPEHGDLRPIQDD